MNINTPADFIEALLHGPYAWPGGYPVFFYTSDGGALAFGTAFAERREILSAIKDNDKHSGWRVIGMDVNWEDPDLYDDHDGGRIESAYAEDDATSPDYVSTPKGYNAWVKRMRSKRAA